MEYLKLYDGGKLPSLAGKIGDGGQYINQLQYKFSSDAANWVWNTDTVNAKIDELICEYEIVEISNRILTKNTTFADTIRAWVDKLSQICIAYSVIKNELGDARPFYELLSFRSGIRAWDYPKIAVCPDSGCACYSLKSQFSPSQRRSFSPPKSVLYCKKISGRRTFLWHSNVYLPGFIRGTTESPSSSSGF